MPNTDQLATLAVLIGDLTDQSAQLRDAVGILRLESNERHGETRIAVMGLSTRVDTVVEEVEKLKKSVLEVREDKHRVNNILHEHALKISTLEGQLDTLFVQVAQMKSDMAEERNLMRRSFTEAAEVRRLETQAIQNHIEKLESAIQANTVSSEKRDLEMTKVADGLSAVIDELGIEDRTALGRQPRPGEVLPPPKLRSLEAWAKSSRIVQAVVALGVVADVLARLFHIGH